MIRPSTSQKLRESFVRAARQMLAEAGVPLELRKVAGRVGKSRTAPYLVFGKTEEGGGLDALRVAVAADGFHDLMDELRNASNSATDAAARLREVARAYLEFARREPRLFQLMFGPEVARAVADFGRRPSQRPEVPHLLRARAEADDLIRALAEDCQRAGVMASDDARSLAMGVGTMLHGTALLLRDGQPGVAGEVPEPAAAACALAAFFLGGDPAPLNAAVEALSAAQVTRGLGAAALESSPALRRARQARRVFQGSRILWVDDRHESIAAEQRALEALGGHITRARDTLEALEELQALLLGAAPDSFDLIVSDIARHDSRTAGLDELPLLRRAAPATPVVFYVPRMEPGTTRPPGSLGITDDPSELLHLVLDVLERKRS